MYLPCLSWTIPINVQLSQSILNYPRLSQTNPDYLKLSPSIPNYPCLSWTIPVYPPQLSPSITVYPELSLSIQNYHHLSRPITIYLELSSRVTRKSFISITFRNAKDIDIQFTESLISSIIAKNMQCKPILDMVQWNWSKILVAYFLAIPSSLQNLEHFV